MRQERERGWREKSLWKKEKKIDRKNRKKMEMRERERGRERRKRKKEERREGEE
jgi:hypothetical protein